MQTAAHSLRFSQIVPYYGVPMVSRLRPCEHQGDVETKVAVGFLTDLSKSLPVGAAAVFTFSETLNGGDAFVVSWSYYSKRFLALGSQPT